MSQLDKMRKWGALYVIPNGDPDHNCYNCRLYLSTTNRCAILGPSVDLTPQPGIVPVCGYWNPRKQYITPLQSGFTWVKGTGVRCGNCEEFEPPSSCEKVRGKISPDACCARWDNHSLEVV